LSDGTLTLTVVGLLAPHLTADNYVALLDAARHKTRREVEHLIAEIHPRPDVSSSIRKLPASKHRVLPTPDVPDAGPTAPGPAKSHGEREHRETTQSPQAHAHVAPLSPERYKVQFTVSLATLDKLRRVQDLLRHTIPNGDPAAIVDRALDALLMELNRTRLAAASRPGKSRPTAPDSRHIPAAVKRAVWTRDGGRCAFRSARGRCSETGRLEFHHVVPYARGGPTVVDNIQLRCAAHNAYEAELDFGPRHPALVRERYSAAAPL
jgi:hypothetical protein